jgi:hypothetical protein
VLRISGTSVNPPRKLLSEVEDAVKNQNFAKLLNPRIEFNINLTFEYLIFHHFSRVGIRGSRRQFVSLGRGVEIETVHLTFE